ncbi:MAG TPA: ATP-dependent DNA ligase [Polyangiaceae bacterium]|nr:ATP-dependent DNA ligase [Polyangiaceae bacterium]
MTSPPFLELATTSALLARTRSRLEKQRLLVALLAGVPPEDVAAAVGWLVGEPLAAPLGVGPAQLWQLAQDPGVPAPGTSTLTLRDVESRLDEAKKGSHAEKLARVTELYAALTAPERALFAGALTGSLRQGSLGGVMLLAVAERAGRPEADVRRVVMLRGSLPAAAATLLGGDAGDAPPSAIELFRFLAPMLASPAESVEAATEGLGEAATEGLGETQGHEVQVEWKIDGVRAQIHKQGSRVAVYSRQGNDVTEGCRPLVPAFAALDAGDLVLDGEVVLSGPDGAPRPFQDSFSALASKSVPAGDTLRAYLFDCLHRDGVDLLDAPLSARLEALAAVAPPALVVPSARVTTVADAKAFYAAALAAGNEGVVVKDLAAPYRFGARGKAWQKVKEFATVDLVVLAVEWGSGRRKGLLSNLHLGARRDDGTFCMIGKTFKGLTDELLRWQTARLLDLATEQTDHVVHVRPELVVEIRYNDVQRSPRYPGGIALRFARVVRYREDKPASETEPLAALVARAPGGGPAAGAKEEAARKREAKKAAKKRQLSLFGE